MRSSAAFIFQNRSLPHAPHRSTQATREAPQALQISDSSVSPWPPREAAPHRAPPTSSERCAEAELHTARIPRPVTARQLWSPFLRATNVANAASAQGAHGGVEASARVGDASLLLDGAPCSSVVVCGRVVARKGPEENGSLGLAHPYSLLVLSDMTACVCVVQYHTVWFPDEEAVMPDAQRPPSSSSLSLLSAAADTTMTHTSERCFPHVPWSQLLSKSGGTHSAQTAQTEPIGTADMSNNAATADAATAAASTTVCDVTTPPPEVVCARQMASRAHTTDVPWTKGVADHLKSGAMESARTHNTGVIESEELDIQPGDYVLCVGRLCFADVEKGLSALFSSLCLPSPISHLSAAPARAAGAYNGDLCHAHDACSSRCLSAPCSDVAPLPTTHVWLPHAEEPVPWSELEALGLSPETLPAGTRLLTSLDDLTDAAHGTLTQPAKHQGRTVTAPPSSHSGDTTKGACAASGYGEGTPFAIKGKVTLLHDSNECMFWALSALHTHLRFSRRSSATPC